MKPKYIKFVGKHPQAEKEKRVYKETPDASWKNYGCSYDEEYFKIDIDDYDHKTNALDEPIHENPRSEAVLSLLEAQKVNYNAIRTEHGVHLFFKKPSFLEAKNKINWYCFIGIKIEAKFPASDDHIPLMLNGVERQFIRGSVSNENVDEAPFWILPMQKSKNKPFDLDFPKGDRTQKLGAFLFHLMDKGLTPEQAFNTVRFMNEFVFENPIKKRTLEAEVLNESTFEKLKEAQKTRNDKNLSHVVVAEEIIDRFTIITTNGTCYSYEGGVYKEFSDERIKAYICQHYPNQKDNFRKEVLTYLKGKSYVDYPEEDGLVNVKNGILSFDEKGDVAFLQHSKDIISFRQFNAEYNPASTYKPLEDYLDTVLNQEADQLRAFKQLLGYLLMNHVKYQKIFFFVGMPNTGKSTTLGIIRNFCGKENVSSVQLADLSKPHATTPLVNKTANIFADLKKAKLLSSEMFKMLADGGYFTVDPKFKNAFSYSFKGKILFGINQFPDFSSDLSGVPRRILSFEFKHKIIKGSKEENPHIEEELSKNPECMSAMLNMALEGYKDLTENKGFIETKSSIKALNDFISENDSVEKWIQECNITEQKLLCEPIKDGFVGLYPDYAAFCLSAGEEAKPQKDFTASIKEKYGFISYQKELTAVDGKRIRFRMFRKN